MVGLAVLLVVAVIAAAAALGYVAGRASVQEGPRAADAVDAATVAAVRREISALRALVARVKDIAWDQREVDPALSTIIIEEIREHERRELDP